MPAPVLLSGHCLSPTGMPALRFHYPGCLASHLYHLFSFGIRPLLQRSTPSSQLPSSTSLAPRSATYTTLQESSSPPVLAATQHNALRLLLSLGPSNWCITEAVFGGMMAPYLVKRLITFLAEGLSPIDGVGPSLASRAVHGLGRWRNGT